MKTLNEVGINLKAASRFGGCRLKTPSSNLHCKSKCVLWEKIEVRFLPAQERPPDGKSTHTLVQDPRSHSPYYASPLVVETTPGFRLMGPGRQRNQARRADPTAGRQTTWGPPRGRRMEEDGGTPAREREHRRRRRRRRRT